MQKLFTKQHFKTALALGIAAGMLVVQPVLANGEPFKKKYVLSASNPEEVKPAKKNKAKTKTFASLNNSSVKIYPDVVKRDMHVVAKENEGKPIDFFVFDVEGSLVQHYKMKAKDHNKISGLGRGTYVYRVFCGDDETAAGNFEIR
ncbi:MAG: hypothetical protein SGI83_18670 [Bacteroidota bacterium]|nr:hypothetical protein [Bacteroidota bacterium]